jgi:hypothetical protein
MSILLKQHLNTHKQQLRALGLQIIMHHTHAPVHKQATLWVPGVVVDGVVPNVTLHLKAQVRAHLGMYQLLVGCCHMS